MSETEHGETVRGWLLTVSILAAGAFGGFVWGHMLGKDAGYDRAVERLGDPRNYPRGSCSELAVSCSARGGDSLLRNTGEFVCRRTEDVIVGPTSAEGPGL